MGGAGGHRCGGNRGLRPLTRAVCPRSPTFNHASYPQAPEQCLARFDELKQSGLETFAKKHDAYWDILLNENLPQPVIDLPIPDDQQVSLFQAENAEPRKRSRRKA